MKQPFGFYEKIFNELIPFNQYVGMRLLELSEGYAKAIIPFQQHLLGDARVQAIHGGVISAAMDAVGGIAGITTLTSYEDKLVTIDMRVDYIRSARNT
ncbi:MAG TPA: hotdog fold thioesterase, partial [Chitinophagales bacterium]|nr:hotdog fold thioesterase [Chitinophagales bacterium]